MSEIQMRERQNEDIHDYQKYTLLKSFEDKWGDDLRVVLHEMDIRDIFNDIAKIIDKVRCLI